MRLPVTTYTTRLGVRVPAEVRERAEQAARAAGWPLSDWLRHIIEIGATAELEAAAELRSSPPPSKPAETFLRQRPGSASPDVG